jgi:hypothetical protein
MRGRKPKPRVSRADGKVFCFHCRRPIKFVSEFYFDPSYSDYAYHVVCVLRKEKYDQTVRFTQTWLWRLHYG